MATRTALHKVFVYGTLKTGQPNNYLLKGPGVARLVGAAKLAQRYPLVVATPYGIPGLLAREGAGQVRLEASGVRQQTISSPDITQIECSLTLVDCW